MRILQFELSKPGSDAPEPSLVVIERLFRLSLRQRKHPRQPFSCQTLQDFPHLAEREAKVFERKDAVHFRELLRCVEPVAAELIDALRFEQPQFVVMA